MPLVKLFRSKVEEFSRESQLALSLMQTEIDVFMLPLDIDVRQVNGPYVNYLPPEKKGLSERVVYTANVVYDRKSS